ncbi:hypothetical protein HDV01_002056 [Terramyces sp. JEL0728]|nr:hypothetical protein HDV01_002056 [Terramyces sp. JEL0728]
MVFGELSVAETQLQARLQQIVTETYQKYSDCIPGAIFSAVYKGKVISVDPYGYANAELQVPINPETTIFKIGSITQVFTAIALLQSWETHFEFRDLFTKDLNDVIWHLETNFAKNSIGFSMPNNGFHEPVTIWNLLTHTAGLEDGSLGIDTHSYDSKSTMNLDPLYFNRIHLLNDNFVKRVYPPSTIISHSNGGYVILGYIVELLTNRAYPIALKELLLEPLQMFSTALDSHSMNSKEKNLILVEPHTAHDSDFALLPTEEQIQQLSMSDGGIALTIGDMNNLLKCLTNRGKFCGKQVISEEIISLLMDKQFDSHLGSNYSATCGMTSMQLPKYGGLVQVCQDGYLPGHASQLVLYPEHEFGYFLSINFDHPWKIFGSMMETIRSALFTPTNPVYSKILTSANPDLKQYAGYYISTRKQDTNFLSLFMRLRDKKHTTISITEDGSALVKNNSVYLFPMYYGDQTIENLVFLESESPDSSIQSLKTSAFTKGRLYTGMETIFYDDNVDSFHKINWFQRIEYHEKAIKTIAASASINLLHQLIISKKSKLSVANVMIGVGILALPCSVSLLSLTTRNKIELFCKKPPRWVKLVFGMSHIGISIACGYLMTKNRKLSESVALCSGLATLALLRYWNLEFWKI